MLPGDPCDISPGITAPASPSPSIGLLLISELLVALTTSRTGNDDPSLLAPDDPLASAVLPVAEGTGCKVSGIKYSLCCCYGVA